MANKEKIRARRPFGHVGSLLYLPYEGDDGGVGTFETTRKLVDRTSSLVSLELVCT